MNTTNTTKEAPPQKTQRRVAEAQSPHTTGPWTIIADNGRVPEHRYTVLTTGASAICEVFSRNFKHHKLESDPEALANARLISVAPEMLALLERSVDLDELKGQAYWDEWTSEAKALIKRAREGGR